MIKKFNFMKKLFLLLLCVFFFGCSSDDDFIDDSSYNIQDFNNVEFYADGNLVENDSIRISVNYCCNKTLRIDMTQTGKELGRRNLMQMEMHKDGSVKRINYDLYNEPRSYRSPFFKIPNDFLNIEVFDFDEEAMDLHLKFTSSLLRYPTGFPGPESIEIDVDLDAKIVHDCRCTPGAQTMNDAYMELNPNFNFLYFNKGSSSQQFGPRLYRHRSRDVNGYRFTLYSKDFKIEDFEVGSYELNAENESPRVDFRKYIGEPHAYSNNIVPEEWEVYDINGVLEVVEKLENGLNRIKIDFTASKDGEVIYEFSDANGLL